MDQYQSSGATLLFLVLHFTMAVAFWKMAARTKEEPKWFALVPILNLVLFLKLARRPLWWLLLFLVPIVNLVTVVVATMSLCERFGVNKWWGLVALLSPLNIVLFLYLAYGTDKAEPPKSPPPVPQIPPVQP